MGTLVGRDAELARLRGLLDDAAEGRAVTGLVGGDAGIGKSRLVAEVMQIAERDGFTVLCGQCAEIGDSVPYLPFADAFRTAPPHIEQAVKARPVLSRLLPDGDGQAEEADRSGLARQQMFGAVLSLLSELAVASPVLLVLEDLHWADATTRHLVTFLARMLHRERVAIIGTYRTDDLHRRHPLRDVDGGAAAGCPWSRLSSSGPLPAAALAEHLSSLPNGPSRLSTATAQHPGRASGGQCLLRGGAAYRVLVRGHHGQHAAHRPSRAAAVAGGARVRRGAAGAAGGGRRRRRAERPPGACGFRPADDAYEEAVREAAGQQLLAPDGPAGFRFRHALLREAIYGDLMPGERTRLHAKLASLLAGVPGAAAELAHH